jgi:hypothetical protein
VGVEDIEMSVAAVRQSPDGAGWELVQSARAILNAMENQDLANLERELDRAACPGCLPPARTSHQEEQLELLSAVATHLKQSIPRFASGVAASLDPVQTDLNLLRHLCRPPA